METTTKTKTGNHLHHEVSDYSVLFIDQAALVAQNDGVQ